MGTRKQHLLFFFLIIMEWNQVVAARSFSLSNTDGSAEQVNQALKQYLSGLNLTPDQTANFIITPPIGAKEPLLQTIIEAAQSIVPVLVPNTPNSYKISSGKREDGTLAIIYLRITLGKALEDGNKGNEESSNKISSFNSRNLNLDLSSSESNPSELIARKITPMMKEFEPLLKQHQTTQINLNISPPLGSNEQYASNVISNLRTTLQQILPFRMESSIKTYIKMNDDGTISNIKITITTPSALLGNVQNVKLDLSQPFVNVPQVVQTELSTVVQKLSLSGNQTNQIQINIQIIPPTGASKAVVQSIVTTIKSVLVMLIPKAKLSIQSAMSQGPNGAITNVDCEISIELTSPYNLNQIYRYINLDLSNPGRNLVQELTHILPNIQKQVDPIIDNGEIVILNINIRPPQSINDRFLDNATDSVISVLQAIFLNKITVTANIKNDSKGEIDEVIFIVSIHPYNEIFKIDLTKPGSNFGQQITNMIPHIRELVNEMTSKNESAIFKLKIELPKGAMDNFVETSVHGLVTSLSHIFPNNEIEVKNETITDTSGNILNVNLIFNIQSSSNPSQDYDKKIKVNLSKDENDIMQVISRVLPDLEARVSKAQINGESVDFEMNILPPIGSSEKFVRPMMNKVLITLSEIFFNNKIEAKLKLAEDSQGKIISVAYVFTIQPSNLNSKDGVRIVDLTKPGSDLVRELTKVLSDLEETIRKDHSYGEPSRLDLKIQCPDGTKDQFVKDAINLLQSLLPQILTNTLVDVQNEVIRDTSGNVSSLNLILTVPPNYEVENLGEKNLLYVDLSKHGSDLIQEIIKIFPELEKKVNIAQMKGEPLDFNISVKPPRKPNDKFAELTRHTVLTTLSEIFPNNKIEAKIDQPDNSLRKFSTFNYIFTIQPNRNNLNRDNTKVAYVDLSKPESDLIQEITPILLASKKTVAKEHQQGQTANFYLNIRPPKGSNDQFIEDTVKNLHITVSDIFPNTKVEVRNKSIKDNQGYISDLTLSITIQPYKFVEQLSNEETLNVNLYEPGDDLIQQVIKVLPDLQNKVKKAQLNNVTVNFNLNIHHPDGYSKKINEQIMNNVLTILSDIFPDNKIKAKVELTENMQGGISSANFVFIISTGSNIPRQTNREILNVDLTKPKSDLVEDVTIAVTDMRERISEDQRNGEIVTFDLFIQIPGGSTDQFEREKSNKVFTTISEIFPNNRIMYKTRAIPDFQGHTNYIHFVYTIHPDVNSEELNGKESNNEKFGVEESNNTEVVNVDLTKHGIETEQEIVASISDMERKINTKLLNGNTVKIDFKVQPPEESSDQSVKDTSSKIVTTLHQMFPNNKLEVHKNITRTPHGNIKHLSIVCTIHPNYQREVGIIKNERPDGDEPSNVEVMNVDLTNPESNLLQQISLLVPHLRKKFGQQLEKRENVTFVLNIQFQNSSSNRSMEDAINTVSVALFQAFQNDNVGIQAEQTALIRRNREHLRLVFTIYSKKKPDNPKIEYSFSEKPDIKELGQEEQVIIDLTNPENNLEEEITTLIPKLKMKLHQEQKKGSNVNFTLNIRPPQGSNDKFVEDTMHTILSRLSHILPNNRVSAQSKTIRSHQGNIKHLIMVCTIQSNPKADELFEHESEEPNTEAMKMSDTFSFNITNSKKDITHEIAMIIPDLKNRLYQGQKKGKPINFKLNVPTPEGSSDEFVKETMNKVLMKLSQTFFNNKVIIQDKKINGSQDNIKSFSIIYTIVPNVRAEHSNIRNPVGDLEIANGDLNLKNGRIIEDASIEETNNRSAETDHLTLNRGKLDIGNERITEETIIEESTNPSAETPDIKDREPNVKNQSIVEEASIEGETKPSTETPDSDKKDGELNAENERITEEVITEGTTNPSAETVDLDIKDQEPFVENERIVEADFIKESTNPSTETAYLDNKYREPYFENERIVETDFIQGTTKPSADTAGIDEKHEKFNVENERVTEEAIIEGTTNPSAETADLDIKDQEPLVENERIVEADFIKESTNPSTETANLDIKDREPYVENERIVETDFIQGTTKPSADTVGFDEKDEKFNVENERITEEAIIEGTTNPSAETADLDIKDQEPLVENERIVEADFIKESTNPSTETANLDIKDREPYVENERIVETDFIQGTTKPSADTVGFDEKDEKFNVENERITEEAIIEGTTNPSAETADLDIKDQEPLVENERIVESDFIRESANPSTETANLDIEDREPYVENERIVETDFIQGTTKPSADTADFDEKDGKFNVENERITEEAIIEGTTNPSAETADLDIKDQEPLVENERIVESDFIRESANPSTETANLDIEDREPYVENGRIVETDFIQGTTKPSADTADFDEKDGEFNVENERITEEAIIEGTTNPSAETADLDIKDQESLVENERIVEADFIKESTNPSTETANLDIEDQEPYVENERLVETAFIQRTTTPSADTADFDEKDGKFNVENERITEKAIIEDTTNSSAETSELYIEDREPYVENGRIFEENFIQGTTKPSAETADFDKKNGEFNVENERIKEKAIIEDTTYPYAETVNLDIKDGKLNVEHGRITEATMFEGTMNPSAENADLDIKDKELIVENGSIIEEDFIEEAINPTLGSAELDIKDRKLNIENERITEEAIIETTNSFAETADFNIKNQQHNVEKAFTGENTILSTESADVDIKDGELNVENGSVTEEPIIEETKNPSAETADSDITDGELHFENEHITKEAIIGETKNHFAETADLDITDGKLNVDYGHTTEEAVTEETTSTSVETADIDIKDKELNVENEHITEPASMKRTTNSPADTADIDIKYGEPNVKTERITENSVIEETTNASSETEELDIKYGKLTVGNDRIMQTSVIEETKNPSAETSDIDIKDKELNVENVTETASIERTTNSSSDTADIDIRYGEPNVEKERNTEKPIIEENTNPYSEIAEFDIKDGKLNVADESIMQESVIGDTTSSSAETTDSKDGELNIKNERNTERIATEETTNPSAETAELDIEDEKLDVENRRITEKAITEENTNPSATEFDIRDGKLNFENERVMQEAVIEETTNPSEEFTDSDMKDTELNVENERITQQTTNADSGIADLMIKDKELNVENDRTTETAFTEDTTRSSPETTNFNIKNGTGIIENERFTENSVIEETKKPFAEPTDLDIKDTELKVENEHIIEEAIIEKTTNTSTETADSDIQDEELNVENERSNETTFTEDTTNSFTETSDLDIKYGEGSIENVRITEKVIIEETTNIFAATAASDINDSEFNVENGSIIEEAVIEETRSPSAETADSDIKDGELNVANDRIIEKAYIEETTKHSAESEDSNIKDGELNVENNVEKCVTETTNIENSNKPEEITLNLAKPESNLIQEIASILPDLKYKLHQNIKKGGGNISFTLNIKLPEKATNVFVEDTMNRIFTTLSHVFPRNKVEVEEKKTKGSQENIERLIIVYNIDLNNNDQSTNIRSPAIIEEPLGEEPFTEEDTKPEVKTVDLDNNHKADKTKEHNVVTDNLYTSAEERDIESIFVAHPISNELISQEPNYPEEVTMDLDNNAEELNVQNNKFSQSYVEELNIQEEISVNLPNSESNSVKKIVALLPDLRERFQREQLKGKAKSFALNIHLPQGSTDKFVKDTMDTLLTSISQLLPYNDVRAQTKRTVDSGGNTERLSLVYIIHPNLNAENSNVILSHPLSEQPYTEKSRKPEEITVTLETTTADSNFQIENMVEYVGEPRENDENNEQNVIVGLCTHSEKYVQNDIFLKPNSEERTSGEFTKQKVITLDSAKSKCNLTQEVATYLPYLKSKLYQKQLKGQDMISTFKVKLPEKTTDEFIEDTIHTIRKTLSEMFSGYSVQMTGIPQEDTDYLSIEYTIHANSNTEIPNVRDLVLLEPIGEKTVTKETRKPESITVNFNVNTDEPHKQSNIEQSIDEMFITGETSKPKNVIVDLHTSNEDRDIQNNSFAKLTTEEPSDEETSSEEKFTVNLAKSETDLKQEIKTFLPDLKKKLNQGQLNGNNVSFTMNIQLPTGSTEKLAKDSIKLVLATLSETFPNNEIALQWKPTEATQETVTRLRLIGTIHRNHEYENIDDRSHISEPLGGELDTEEPSNLGEVTLDLNNDSSSPIIESIVEKLDTEESSSLEEDTVDLNNNSPAPNIQKNIKNSINEESPNSETSNAEKITTDLGANTEQPNFHNNNGIPITEEPNYKEININLDKFENNLTQEIELFLPDLKKKLYAGQINGKDVSFTMNIQLPTGSTEKFVKDSMKSVVTIISERFPNNEIEVQWKLTKDVQGTITRLHMIGTIHRNPESEKIDDQSPAIEPVIKKLNNEEHNELEEVTVDLNTNTSPPNIQNNDIKSINEEPSTWETNNSEKVTMELGTNTEERNFHNNNGLPSIEGSIYQEVNVNLAESENNLMQEIKRFLPVLRKKMYAEQLNGKDMSFTINIPLPAESTEKFVKDSMKSVVTTLSETFPNNEIEVQWKPTKDVQGTITRLRLIGTIHRNPESEKIDDQSLLIDRFGEINDNKEPSNLEEVTSDLNTPTWETSNSVKTKLESNTKEQDFHDNNGFPTEESNYQEITVNLAHSENDFKQEFARFLPHLEKKLYKEQQRGKEMSFVLNLELPEGSTDKFVEGTKNTVLTTLSQIFPYNNVGVQTERTHNLKGNTEHLRILYTIKPNPNTEEPIIQDPNILRPVFAEPNTKKLINIEKPIIQNDYIVDSDSDRLNIGESSYQQKIIVNLTNPGSDLVQEVNTFLSELKLKVNENQSKRKNVIFALNIQPPEGSSDKYVENSRSTIFAMLSQIFPNNKITVQSQTTRGPQDAITNLAIVHTIHPNLSLGERNDHTDRKTASGETSNIKVINVDLTNPDNDLAHEVAHSLSDLQRTVSIEQMNKENIIFDLNIKPPTGSDDKFVQNTIKSLSTNLSQIFPNNKQEVQAETTKDAQGKIKNFKIFYTIHTNRPTDENGATKLQDISEKITFNNNSVMSEEPETTPALNNNTSWESDKNLEETIPSSSSITDIGTSMKIGGDEPIKPGKREFSVDLSKPGNTLEGQITETLFGTVKTFENDLEKGNPIILKLDIRPPPGVKEDYLRITSESLSSILPKYFPNTMINVKTFPRNDSYGYLTAFTLEINISSTKQHAEESKISINLSNSKVTLNDQMHTIIPTIVTKIEENLNEGRPATVNFKIKPPPESTEEYQYVITEILTPILKDNFPDNEIFVNNIDVQKNSEGTLNEIIVKITIEPSEKHSSGEKTVINLSHSGVTLNDSIHKIMQNALFKLEKELKDGHPASLNLNIKPPEGSTENYLEKIKQLSVPILEKYFPDNKLNVNASVHNTAEGYPTDILLKITIDPFETQQQQEKFDIDLSNSEFSLDDDIHKVMENVILKVDTNLKHKRPATLNFHLKPPHGSSDDYLKNITKLFSQTLNKNFPANKISVNTRAQKNSQGHLTDIILEMTIELGEERLSEEKVEINLLNSGQNFEDQTQVIMSNLAPKIKKKLESGHEATIDFNIKPPEETTDDYLQVTTNSLLKILTNFFHENKINVTTSATKNLHGYFNDLILKVTIEPSTKRRTQEGAVFNISEAGVNSSNEALETLPMVENNMKIVRQTTENFNIDIDLSISGVNSDEQIRNNLSSVVPTIANNLKRDRPSTLILKIKPPQRSSEDYMQVLTKSLIGNLKQYFPDNEININVEAKKDPEGFLSDIVMAITFETSDHEKDRFEIDLSIPEISLEDQVHKILPSKIPKIKKQLEAGYPATLNFNIKPPKESIEDHLPIIKQSLEQILLKYFPGSQIHIKNEVMKDSRGLLSNIILTVTIQTKSESDIEIDLTRKGVTLEEQANQILPTLMKNFQNRDQIVILNFKIRPPKRSRKSFLRKATGQLKSLLSEYFVNNKINVKTNAKTSRFGYLSDVVLTFTVHPSLGDEENNIATIDLDLTSPELNLITQMTRLLPGVMTNLKGVLSNGDTAILKVNVKPPEKAKRAFVKSTTNSLVPILSGMFPKNYIHVKPNASIDSKGFITKFAPIFSIEPVT